MHDPVHRVHRAPAGYAAKASSSRSTHLLHSLWRSTTTNNRAHPHDQWHTRNTTGKARSRTKSSPSDHHLKIEAEPRPQNDPVHPVRHVDSPR